MSKEEAISILEDLRDYVKENWIDSEYKSDVDEAEKAVEMAVLALKESGRHTNRQGK